MTLDLSQIATQVEAMGQSLSGRLAQRRERQARARREFDRQAEDLKPLRTRASRGKTTWLVAGLVEEWDRRHPLPSLPPEFAVLATDGSQVDLERHAPASCYLINIGQVLLRYGSHSDAFLSSRASLFYKEEDMFVADPANGHRQVPLDGTILRVRRSIMEAQALLDLAAQVPGDLPALALLDGTLILWELAGKRVEDFVRRRLVEEFLLPLEGFMELNRVMALPLSSYVSHPRSTEVVNLLRIAVCPHDPANCDRYCPTQHPTEGRFCDDIASGVRDGDLFRDRLEPGERSPLYRSRSPILELYGQHGVHFFYVNVGEEIARVEVPGWVAADTQKLDLAHALVVDQARRGQGYPVALMEAHEQAVVHASDRQAFWTLVEEALAEGRLPTTSSPKAQSKRIRGI